MRLAKRTFTHKEHTFASASENHNPCQRVIQAKRGEHAEKKVSRRDSILLPLIGLVTMVVMAGSARLLAGWLFSKSADGVEKCMQLTDPALGVHGKPSAVCWDKGRETALIEYRLNGCGYRMDVECGPPQPGTYRIVTIGSSFVMGYGVPRGRSLAALLPVELSRRTGRKIEAYNEGIISEHPQVAALRFHEVLAAQPNMVLWMLGPYDIGVVTLDPALMNPAPAAHSASSMNEAGFVASGWLRFKEAAEAGTIAAVPGKELRKAREMFLHSATGVMLLHYLYQSQSQYVDSYLRGPDSTIGFLRAEPSWTWSNDLRQFDKAAAKIEGQAKAAGIPLVVVLVPNRAEATMISMGRWPAGFDPYKLGEKIQPVVESHGGTYIDILTDFRAIPDAGKYYFPVDSHPNANGHALLSRLIAKELTSGVHPALHVGGRLQPGSGRGR